MNDKLIYNLYIRDPLPYEEKLKALGVTFAIKPILSVFHGWRFEVQTTRSIKLFKEIEKVFN